METRLKRGDTGINELDAACKEHDIAYSQNSDITERLKADKTLQRKAWKRVKSKTSSFGEKAAALLVTAAMKGKRKLGMGLKTKKCLVKKGGALKKKKKTCN